MTAFDHKCPFCQLQTSNPWHVLDCQAVPTKDELTRRLPPLTMEDHKRAKFEYKERGKFDGIRS